MKKRDEMAIEFAEENFGPCEHIGSYEYCLDGFKSGWNAALRESDEVKALVEALLNIKKHQEVVSRGMAQVGGSWVIADKALENYKKALGDA